MLRTSNRDVISNEKEETSCLPLHTCVLLLILILWLMQTIFQSKGDKLSSFAECRIQTQGVSGTESPADWMPAGKPTELSRVKLKKLELDSPSLWSASIPPTRPHRRLAFAPGSGDIYAWYQPLCFVLKWTLVLAMGIFVLLIMMRSPREIHKTHKEPRNSHMQCGDRTHDV